MLANRKAVAEVALGTALTKQLRPAKFTPYATAREARLERAVLRESQARFVLREAVQALSLDDFTAASIFAAASSVAKAEAHRILAERS